MADGEKIENCALKFAFECPQVWSKLNRTSDKLIRFCDVCQQDVHYCGSAKAAMQKAEQGYCIVLSKHAERQLPPTPKPKRRALKVGMAHVEHVPKPEPVEKEEWRRPRDGKRKKKR